MNKEEGLEWYWAVTSAGSDCIGSGDWDIFPELEEHRQELKKELQL